MTSNPKRRIIAINANNGAFVSIRISVNGCHYVEISEVPPDAGAFASSPYAPEGLNVTFPDDNFTLEFAYGPGDTITFGNKDAMGHPGQGRGLGFAARVDNLNNFTTIPATVLCKLLSATATGTQVMVSEWI